MPNDFFTANFRNAMRRKRRKMKTRRKKRKRMKRKMREGWGRKERKAMRAAEMATRPMKKMTQRFDCLWHIQTSVTTLTFLHVLTHTGLKHINPSPLTEPPSHTEIYVPFPAHTLSFSTAPPPPPLLTVTWILSPCCNSLSVCKLWVLTLIVYFVTLHVAAHVVWDETVSAKCS